MTPTEPTYFPDYRTAREDARAADWWRYSMPGQWIGGEWETYDKGDER